MPNRLINETSPYLFQHATTLWQGISGKRHCKKRGRKMNPFFFSIGYAAGHWRHVMKKESFENPAIANIMNQSFINVKVDREERSDLLPDRIPSWGRLMELTL